MAVILVACTAAGPASAEGILDVAFCRVEVDESRGHATRAEPPWLARADANLDALLPPALLDGVELVVVRLAALERPLLESLVPRLAALAWACAGTELHGLGDERPTGPILPAGRHAGHGAVHDCTSLLGMLGGRVDEWPGTGFQRLLAVGRTPSYRLHVRDPGPAGRADLVELGYAWHGATGQWRKDGADDAELAIEYFFIDRVLLGGDSSGCWFEVRSARCRHSSRVGDIQPACADDDDLADKHHDVTPFA